MSIVFAVERALQQKRKFGKVERGCATFDVLLRHCPPLFAQVDNELFDGAISAFLRKSHIKFEVVASNEGAAGVTTYTDGCMRVSLRRDAWVQAFPALVGGNLCHSSDGCLFDVFLHEIVHVLLFSIYLQLDMSPKEVADLIPFKYDTTHNVLFTVWIAAFFGQSTINNSLLLCGTHAPLTFDRSLRETEDQCVRQLRPGVQVRVFHDGQKQTATVLESNTFFKKTHERLKPHHSFVRTASGATLTVPNGLLFC